MRNKMYTIEASNDRHDCLRNDYDELRELVYALIEHLELDVHNGYTFTDKPRKRAIES